MKSDHKLTENYKHIRENSMTQDIKNLDLD